MRWWPFKKKRNVSPIENGDVVRQAARQAAIEAERNLLNLQRKQPEVEREVRETRRLLDRNNFGQLIRESYRRAM